MTPSFHTAWIALSFLIPTPGIALGSLMLYRAANRGPEAPARNSRTEAIAACVCAVIAAAAAGYALISGTDLSAFRAGVFGAIAVPIWIAGFQTRCLLRGSQSRIDGWAVLPSLLLLPIALASVEESLPVWGIYAAFWLILAAAYGLPPWSERWNPRARQFVLEARAPESCPRDLSPA